MIVPGKKTVVAGSGPLLFYVASEIERLGGHVEAVVSLNSRLDWIKAFPQMISQPKLLWQGFKWVFSFYNKTKWQSAPVQFNGEDAVETVTIKNVDHNWSPVGAEQIIEADSVCYGQGLIPVPTIDEMGRTSVEGLYVCGDNAGILGALSAPIRGKNAAQALNQNGVIYDIGAAERFGKAMTALSIPRKELLNLITQNTEVCRCEGISREEIEYEIITGAQSPNAIKSGTRCGMGTCGGRFCSEAQALINENITGQNREEIGLPTARPPLRPMPMNEITETLDYDDLPIPGVSPL
jgi:bacterioferritin-associated ferredoxin